MKKMLFILLLLPFSMLAQDKVKFIAGGVTCSMCSKAIHNSLHLDKNIIRIDPNLETQEWNLQYKKGTFKLESLKSKIEDAGFSINKVWLNEELIYQKKDNNKNKTKKT